MTANTLSVSPGLGLFFEAYPANARFAWAVGAHLLQARVLQRALQCPVYDDGQADETIFLIR